MYIFLPFLLLIFLLSGFFRKEIHPGQNNPVAVAENTVFELKEGDILIRPNWSWLPGSCPVADGRKYGHVALVTRGATGQSISEALENATVVEALFFDQATKEFQFKKENQIRQGKAIVSFGKKFTGIRYRLRIPLTETQAAVMRNFAETQLDGGYNILSVKTEKLIKWKTSTGIAPLWYGKLTLLLPDWILMPTAVCLFIPPTLSPARFLKDPTELCVSEIL